MRSTTKMQFVLMALLLCTAQLLMAHGNQKHVIGTVSEIRAAAISGAEIGAATVTVNTAAEGKVTVNILPETSFVKSGAAAHLADLKVGDRVVIHAIPKVTGSSTVLNATEVRFGVQPASGAGSEMKH